MSTITRIRKEVAILVNKINKTAKNLSSSFKRAWTIIKGKKLVTKLSGVTFGSRPKALARLEKYNRNEIQVTLEREQDNQYDKNALTLNSRKIRYPNTKYSNAVRTMAEGPPKPLCRRRFQTTLRCCGQKPWY